MKPGTPGFIGTRLREAREARGITASALSDLIGVSRAAISQYESGTTPSPESFRRICAALNLNATWFLRSDVAVRGDSTIFFRCMASATKGARLRAERRYDWLRDIVRFLSAKVVFPAVNFPDLDLPNDPSRISEADVEAAATHTRRFWGMNDGPISNVTWLVENNGGVVARIDLHAATLDALSDWESVEGRPYFLLGADKASACRSRFDAAHELGHMILHRGIEKTTYTPQVAFRLMEEQANRFASSFLMPEETFASEFTSYTLDAMLAQKPRWRVSIGAQIKRLGDLGILRDAELKKLWINRVRRKWRASEPLDDTLEPEIPRFLSRCFNALVTKGIMNPAEIMLQLGLPAVDVEQLAGLVPGYFGHAEPEIQFSEEVERNILRFPKVS